MLRTLTFIFLSAGQYKLSVNILLYLTKVPRFEMNAMFLGSIEKEGMINFYPHFYKLYRNHFLIFSDLRSIFTVLSEHKDVPPPMLETMKRSYGVQS